MFLLVGVLQPFTELLIPLCIPSFALLMTNIAKHYLNQNQYSQPQWY